MPVVEVNGVAYAHPGGSELFSDVSFRVPNGRHVALVGPNGVGKSTLLQVMTGELAPSEGSVSRRRLDAAHAPGHRRRRRCDHDGSGAAGSLRVAGHRRGRRPAGRGRARQRPRPRRTHGHRAGRGLRRVGRSRWLLRGGPLGRVLRPRAAPASARSRGRDRSPSCPVASASVSCSSRCSSSDVEIVLLDEPDNFLDLAGKRWLERTINASNKTILFVTPRPRVPQRRRATRS